MRVHCGLAAGIAVIPGPHVRPNPATPLTPFPPGPPAYHGRPVALPADMQKAVEFVTAGSFTSDPSMIAAIGTRIWSPLSDMLRELLSQRVSTTKPQQCGNFGIVLDQTFSHFSAHFSAPPRTHTPPAPCGIYRMYIPQSSQ